MTTDKPNPAQLTTEEKKQASIVIKRLFFEKMGLDPNLSETEIRFGSTSDLSAEDQQKMAMAKGLQLGMEHGINQMLAEIRTQDDLQNVFTTRRRSRGSGTYNNSPCNGSNPSAATKTRRSWTRSIAE